MKSKKTPGAYLENKKIIFFQVGLIIALASVLIAFEWSKSNNNNTLLSGSKIDKYIDEFPPITRTFEKEVIPPVPPQIELIVKPDYLPIENQPTLPSIETCEDELIEMFFLPDEKNITGDGSDIYIVAEEMPEFIGDFRKFISANLHYPKIAKENRIEGTVLIKFVIDEKGNLANAKILRSVDSALDQEALRVINLSPRWKPGKQQTKPVKVAFTFPITFKLAGR